MCISFVLNDCFYFFGGGGGGVGNRNIWAYPAGIYAYNPQEGIDGHNLGKRTWPLEISREVATKQEFVNYCLSMR